MHEGRLAAMMEATRLTREGKLAEATALLQRGSLDPAARPPLGAVPSGLGGLGGLGGLDGLGLEGRGLGGAGLGGGALKDLLSRLPHQARLKPMRRGSVESGPPLPGRWL